MKIATWNIERPRINGKNVPSILNYLTKINADILVLTETNEFINPGNEYNCIHSDKLHKPLYKEGERRISIFSKFPIVGTIKTFREDTSICAKIETPLGKLAVYGTIIGIYGNKGAAFKSDLESQIIDFDTISKSIDLCVIGDFNISFSDNFYFTKKGREKLTNSFELLEMTILTEQIKNNIDHIIISNKFLGNCKKIWSFWNDPENKKERLSDHKGVLVEIFDIPVK